MSMPVIERPENPIDRDQAVNNLIGSVALVETGLSHIINAEGEKIQKVIKADDPTADVPIEDILRVNESVERMVNTVSKLEMILQNKLDIVKDLDTGGSDDVTETMGFSAIHIGGGNIPISPDGSPIVLETVTYLDGFTANGTSDTFTATTAGSYLFQYGFALGDADAAVFDLGIKIDDVINPNTIVEFRGNTAFDRQFYNSVILDLNAGSTVSLVLIGVAGIKAVNPEVGVNLVVTRVA